MSGRHFRSSNRGVDGDRRWKCGTQTGAVRIARLKAVLPAAGMGLERTVLLGLGQCHGTGSVLVMPAKWRLSLRSTARHSLDRHAPV